MLTESKELRRRCQKDERVSGMICVEDRTTLSGFVKQWWNEVKGARSYRKKWRKCALCVSVTLWIGIIFSGTVSCQIPKISL